jgi:HAD superfamily hydrolase (TIGR01549 family)
VAEPNFKAVVLDLFDTLVDWDANRLPMVRWQGREIRSTLPWITPKLEELLGARYQPERFVAVYTTVIKEINAERERYGIEITCSERFLRTLRRLSLEQDGFDLDALAETLTRAHMAGIRGITVAPARRVTAVKRLARHYRLGLLSNFDDAATGHEIIADTGLAKLFEAIIVSADIGMRKPNPLVFERMLGMLGLGDAGDVLFVGDMPELDVAGPKRVGMRAAWINRHGRALPEGIPLPDLVINDLAELPDVLECGQ